ncbi:MAG: 30S ribosomal protein S12 methylthiotransferase RimO [Candidatus Omnitrophica bacterium]|nr:30S ribosomal protein S12 methylthiotransferase RimO [Candidatus Omnitrophota bacterium]
MSQRTSHQPTVHLISLGCPRTLVDSEVYLGRLKDAGMAIVDKVEGADVAVINTCSFIQESIQESIDTVLDAIELKKQGKLKAVVVAGCLVQRFKEGLVKELPEVDGFVGVDGFGDIDAIVRSALNGEHHSLIRRRPQLPHRGQPSRVALTPSHYAYLKVSEGCLKGCRFCVIPKIKGPLASRSIDELVEEARRLIEERGVKELIVVGQDTSDYGVDLYGRPRIADLLADLGKLAGLRWIRLLYCHPSGITPQIIEAIRDIPTVCKYLDTAIEHADDDVLARMNRGITSARLRERVETLRREIPGIALRTAVIVGFPGETEQAFETLLNFIQEMRFDRLGAFQYSNEESSAAFRYPDQVEETVKQRRYDRLMQTQQRLAEEINRQWLGRSCEVMIDEPAPDDSTVFLGRTWADCPEVDGLVYVNSATPLVPGQIVPVTITDTYEYDLVAESRRTFIPHSAFRIPHST